MYQFRFTANAKTDLAYLDKPIARRVIKKLRWVADNFEDWKHEALTGEWQGVFKLRVGDYRVLYTFDQVQEVIIVHIVRHRRDV